MKKRNHAEQNAEIERRIPIKERFQHIVRTAKQEVATVLHEDKKNLLIWGLVYLILAIGSLFLTVFSKGNGWKDFPVTFFNTLPRIASLCLITIPAFLCPYRKTCFALLATLWYVWITLCLANIPIVAVCLLAGAGIAAAIGMFFWEKKTPRQYKHKPFFEQALLWGYAFLILTLLAEIIHRANLLAPFQSAFRNPDNLSVNFLVIFALGLFVFWIPRRKIAFALYSTFWLVLSYTSLLKYKNVNEPVSVLDIFQIKEAMSVLSFLSVAEILLYVFLALLVIVLIVIMIRRERKRPFRLVSFVSTIVSFLLIASMLLGCSLYVPAYQDDEAKLVKSIFFERGFPYSFLNFSLRSQMDDKGKNPPLIAEIWETVAQSFQATTPEIPDVKNIIIVQIESFADPYWFPGAEYERDPAPFIHSLIENYTSGKVHVPVFGGQTVKSEFETLTGMNIDFLNFGTNPYVQILNNQSVDSYVRFLNAQGFTTTALHNYQGEFFSRNDVYKNLGFDRFIPYEFMPNVEKKEGEIWANDAVLVEEVQKILDAGTGEKQFIFTVTVQLHGNYMPLAKEDYPMEISGFTDSSLEARVAYYISQMIEVDSAIEQLVTYLEQRDEPTYVAFYSDHLPSLFSDVPEYTDDVKYTTDFFSWNNLGLEKDEDQEFELYYLTNYINSILGLDGTFLNKFHAVFHDREKYLEYFKTVQYYTLNPNLPEAEELERDYPLDFPNEGFVFGLTPLTITNIVQDQMDPTRYLIQGTGLTKDTYLAVNGRIYSLTLENENSAYLEGFDRILDETSLITLRVIGEKYGAVLAESKNYVYSGGSGGSAGTPRPQ